MSLQEISGVLSGRTMRSGIATSIWIGLAASAALGQYPGVIKASDRAEPILRAVSVLEYTGDPGKPKASRLVPIVVFDGEQLNDGTIYLKRPQPLALAGGTEYELQTGGKPEGIYDVYGAREINGAWLGFGAWKPLTKAAEAQAANAFNTSTLYNGKAEIDDDKPVLKRKHPKGTDTEEADAGSGSGKGSPTASGIGGTGASPARSTVETDPDRPTLKKKSAEDSSAPAPGVSNAGGGKPSGDADPDRPTLHRSRKPAEPELQQASNAAPDPDRPRLKHGKPADLDTTESPRLTGYPPDMQQAVAVSDSRSRAEHPWQYSWANPEDEAKMKASLEEIARKALGLDVPPPQTKPVRKTAVSAKGKKSMSPPVPPEPVALAEEKVRVFELSYGAPATMVFTAASPKAPDAEQATSEATPGAADQPTAPVIKRGKPTSTIEVKQTQPGLAGIGAPKGPPQKFVTLVAQPDLYGGVMVLLKGVTDSAHLDETPRMRLIDAVDVMGDNRGALLFELRGQTQRQFALYRVLRGSAEQLFATVAIP